MIRILLALVLFAAPVREGATVTGKVTVSKDAKKKVVIIRYTGQGVEKRKEPAPSPAVVWLDVPAMAPLEARTLRIQQEGLQFRPRVIAITAGSSVEFPNGDDLFHNVFAKPGNKNEFNLGRFTKDADPVPTKRFNLPGQIDVRCDVHDHMRAFIHVFRHPYFAVAAEDGTFSIPNVPPGKYTLVVWKEDYDQVRREIEVGADGLKVDVDIARLGEKPAGPFVSAACCAAR